ncbi:MAG: hypothetical protein GX681_01135 [Clostridiaceae bacterium]|nr:hypothetical protein [Clostridiaceae bacterium]
MKQGKLINIFKKEDGAGLVLALMVLMVLAVLGVAVAGVTIGSYKLGHISRDSNSAYYIAEAGANLAYADIKNGVMGAYENSANSELNYFTKITERVRAVNGREYQEFSDQFGDKPTATIKIEPEPANDVKEYTIVSTGEINGTSRTVRKPFTVNWVKKKIGLPELPEECAMYIGKSIVPITVKVQGDIITHPYYTRPEKSVLSHFIKHYKAGSTTVKNTIRYETLNMQPYYDLKDAFPDLPSNYEKYDEEENFKSSENHVISANSVNDILRIGTLTVSPSNPLTIDTGTEKATINLVVKNLYVHSDINIIGNGTVNLFVTNYMEFISTSRGLTVGGSGIEADQFNILYSGPNSAYIGKLDIFNDKIIDFKGTIFSSSENANLLFYNNVKLEGIIITFGSSLTMFDYVAVTASIYAPRTTVNAWAYSQLKGTLVANNVTFFGNNEVQYYLNDYLKTYPYGTGTGETPDLGELISSQAAVEP